MSWLSDLSRMTTGKSIGENVGSYVGGAVGGTSGAFIGGKIGGATTRAIDTDRGQATAVPVASQPPREQASSGEQTFRGTQYRGTPGIMPASYTPSSSQQIQPAMYQQAVAPAIIGGGMAVGSAIGRNLFPYMMGGAIAAAPMILDAFGNEKPLRVTRKLKSDVKKAVEMFGVDTVADQLGVNADIVFYILTKKFRNDGAYVTKAAVRKTRQTVRKLKTICDMYDDLRPAAKRRTPARAASRTRVVNVK